MRDSDDDRRDGGGPFLDGVNARLDDAARRGAPLELILSVRGRIAPVPGKHGRRWRLRTARGHIVSFRPEFVVAFNQPSRAHRPTPTSEDSNVPAEAHRRPNP